MKKLNMVFLWFFLAAAVVLTLFAVSFQRRVFAASGEESSGENGGKVTRYYAVRYMESANGYFEVNGIPAFCANQSAPIPLAGTPVSAPVSVADERIRKTLYYGYGGPREWSGMRGFAHGRIITSFSLSYFHTGPQSLKFDLQDEYSIEIGLADFMDYIQRAEETPVDFEVYKVKTGTGYTQDLMYWRYDPDGYVTLEKSSGNQDVTEENSYYSLEGAEYGIYTSRECAGDSLAVRADTGEEAVLITDVSGRTDSICLDAGTYYVKEIKAPSGYQRDETVTTIQITDRHTSDQPCIIQVSDQPVMYPAGIILKKTDAQTGEKPQGNAVLEGALYRVSFYDSAGGSDPAETGENALREWVFQTDTNGYIRYNKNYLVSGSDLYTDEENQPCLPCGILTFEEMEAPSGYLLNPEIITVSVRETGDGTGTVTYQTPIHEEQVLRLKIVKTIYETDRPISGVVFRHVRPDGTSSEYTTDQNGEIQITGLPCGIHEITELSAPEDYQICAKSVAFTVNEDRSITVDGKKELEDPENGIHLQRLEDQSILLEMGNRYAEYSLRIQKLNENGAVLEGAEFTLYTDEDCSSVKECKTTDSTGMLLISGLEPGKEYYLMESTAPQGYRPLTDEEGNPMIWKIRTEVCPEEGTALFYVNDTDVSSEEELYCISGSGGSRTVEMSVYNFPGMELPATGSAGMPLLLASGILLVLIPAAGSKYKERVLK